jgi:Mrp family chromosome partitioning ATPase
MTRIFDALRKAREADPAPPAAPVPVLVPVTPPGAAAAAPGAAPRGPDRARSRAALVPFGAVPPLPADVQREMTGLRVSLESALTERIPRVVFLAASQGGEGTSTVAAQFAASLAGDPRLRVLLVDVHARRPAWGAPAEANGSPRNLALMTLPVLPGNRALDAAGLREVLQSVASGFDWILLDGPPVLESPDAAPLTKAADGVLVVVQAGRTKRPVLARSVDLIHRAGGRVLGVVLNRRRLEIPEFIYRRI